MYDPEEYGITTRRTVIEGESYFEATVGELPDVVGYGATRAEAEEAVVEAIKGLQKMALARGRAFPPPVVPPSEYSGRVTLRLSKTVHRRAAVAASAEQVSLNSFIAEAIADRLAVSARPYADRSVNVAGVICSSGSLAVESWPQNVLMGSAIGTRVVRRFAEPQVCTVGSIEYGAMDNIVHMFSPQERRQ